MRKFFTCLSLFITVLASAQITFKTHIRTAGNSYLFKTIQLNDGSCICVGSTDNRNDDGDILITKLNAQGILVTSKTVGTAGYDDGYSVIKTIDGGFAVSGTLNDKMALLKFDANLTLQWQKQFAVKNTGSYGGGLVQTANGEYFIAGSIINTEDYNAGYLVKTDSLGNALQSKQYFDFANNSLGKIVATKDGNFALLASAGNAGFDKDSVYLIKINSDGDVLWSRYIDNATNNTYGFSLISTTDNALVLGCSTDSIFNVQGTGHTHDQMLMAKFDASGNMLWSKHVLTPMISKSYAMTVTENKAGEYLFGGEIDTYDNTNNADSSFAYAVKLNSSGALQWTKTFDAYKGNRYFTEFDNLLQTADGGYVACGLGFYPDGSNEYPISFLYKFNTDFETCGKNSGSLGTITNVGKGVAKGVIVKEISTTSVAINVKTADVGTANYLCNVLPTQLLSFNANLQNKNVNVQWKTANEINTDHFVVERSNNSIAFQALQQVKAAGNSTNTKTYQIADAQPLFGTSYYRLKQVDKDGSVTYSSIASVTVNTNGTIIISPNPVQQNLHIQLQSTTSNKVILQITDITGKIMSTQQTYLTTGTNNITIPAASLSKGIYILKVIQNDKIQSVKFIKE